jgi:hypothetical protein
VRIQTIDDGAERRRRRPRLVGKVCIACGAPWTLFAWAATVRAVSRPGSLLGHLAVGLEGEPEVADFFLGSALVWLFVLLGLELSGVMLMVSSERSGETLETREWQRAALVAVLAAILLVPVFIVVTHQAR